MKNQKICKVEGCEKQHFGKGYCNLHYNRNRRHGSPHVIAKKSHGMYLSQEYKVWLSIKSRCNCKTHHAYRRYGGAGIKMCAEWENDFMLFYEYMGSRPSETHQIDRIDNSIGYKPGNCEWVTPKQNARKRVGTKLNIEKAREIRALANSHSHEELSKIFGVVKHTISDVIRERTWVEDNE